MEGPTLHYHVGPLTALPTEAHHVQRNLDRRHVTIKMVSVACYVGLKRFGSIVCVVRWSGSYPASPALFNDGSAFPRFPHPSSPLSSSKLPPHNLLLPMAASSYYYRSYSEGMQSHRLLSDESGLRRRCLMMVKQQKTRFYILRRCVSLLLCWHD
ncbi:hypothetical protein BHE74_00021600 [Ensete ventricosum]|nr:hypothetical protein BHE74_00021600 [Ensete ventricosum]